MTDRFPYPFTLDDARGWIDRCIENEDGRTFAIEVEGEAVGNIDLRSYGDVYRRGAEIGYWLGEPFWNRGIVTEAVRAMTEYAFRELGLVRVYARVFEWNAASARVLKKAGYSFEARHRKAITKDGETIDELWYARLADHEYQRRPGHQV